MGSVWVCRGPTSLTRRRSKSVLKFLVIHIMVFYRVTHAGISECFANCRKIITLFLVSEWADEFGTVEASQHAHPKAVVCPAGSVLLGHPWRGVIDKVIDLRQPGDSGWFAIARTIPFISLSIHSRKFHVNNVYVCVWRRHLVYYWRVVLVVGVFGECCWHFERNKTRRVNVFRHG